MTGASSKPSETDIPAFASAVSVLDGNGDPKEVVQLLPFGAPFFGRDGRGPYILRDAAHAQQVIKLTKEISGSADPMVDYDHQSVHAATPGVGGRAPASGWIKKFEVRDDGIYGHIEWTAAAHAALVAKEYRYISPYFRHLKDGTITRIVNAGLTNSPNLDLAAVAAADNGAHPNMKKIAKALGLSEDAGEDEIVTAIKAMQEKSTAMSTSMTAVATSLGLKEDAEHDAIASTAGEIKAAADAKKADAPSIKDFVPREQFDALQSRVEAQELDSVNAMVDKAIEDGKLAPALKQWGIDQAKSDRAAFASFLDKSPTIVDGKTVINKKADDADANTLSEDESAAATALGMSEEDYLKTKNPKKGAE